MLSGSLLSCSAGRFLRGIIKRFLCRPTGEAASTPAHWSGLDPLTESQLRSLVQRGVVGRADVDAETAQKLAQLPPPQQRMVLQKLAEADLSAVVSKRGYVGSLAVELEEKKQESECVACASAITWDGIYVLFKNAWSSVS